MLVATPQQEAYYPFRACRSSAPFYLVLCLFCSLFHLAQWRSSISTTLIQSQPACQSRRDTTPTTIPSPLITNTMSPSLFSSTFFIFSSLSFDFLLSPIPFSHFFSRLLQLFHFYFLSPSFSSSLLHCLFSSLCLSPLPIEGKQPSHKVMGSISIPG